MLFEGESIGQYEANYSPGDIGYGYASRKFVKFTLSDLAGHRSLVDDIMIIFQKYQS